MEFFMPAQHFECVPTIDYTFFARSVSHEEDKMCEEFCLTIFFFFFIFFFLCVRQQQQQKRD